MKLTLRLRRREQPLHEPAAWFFPGEDPARWFAELAEWCGDPATASVRVLQIDGHCCGILVTLSGGNRPSGAPGIPYGRLNSRFYVPIDSELDPPVSAEELAAALAADRDYVFHPVAGLAAFDPDEVLCLSDLQQPPDVRPNDWALAQPGLAFNCRLHSIMPLDAPSPEQFLREGGGDIGSEAEQGNGPPPIENEPRDGPLRDAARGIAGVLAAGAQWLANQLPRGDPPGPIGRAVDWAANQLSQFGAVNEFLRNKEIARLLKLLETNPDEGLRYALPLDDMNASRGIARPSNVLGPRSLNYTGGGRSGPADAWRIEHEKRMQLHRRYRELAERELNLGRYRRAAYIFAHLLNDVMAAAAALKSGSHWREAAALYRDKLKRPADAAKCLIEGGLLAEAIPILISLGQLEEAGELQLRLGEDEAAGELFERAVKQALAGSDHLSAARLLEERLQQPEEALATLWRAWPDADQAEACLRRYFQRLEHAGRRADLLEGLRTIRDQRLTITRRNVRLSVLTEQAKLSGANEIRDFSADAVRIVAARDLPAADEPEVRELMQSLRRLAEGDKLLERDTVRYLRSRTNRQKFKPVSTKQSSRLPLTQRCVLWTPQPTEWVTAIAAAGAIYMFGRCDGRLMFGRANWAGRGEVLTSFSTVAIKEDQLIIAAGDESDGRIFVHLPHAGPAYRLQDTLPATNDFSAASVQEPPFNLDRGLIGMAAARGGVAVVSATNEGWVLYSANHDAPVHSRVLPPLPDGLQRLPIPMTIRQHTQIGWGTRLIGDAPDKMLELGRPIMHLSSPSPFSRQRTAVSFDQGGVVTWAENSEGRRALIGFGEGQPGLVTGFMRQGQFAYCGPAGGEVLDLSERRLRRITEIESPQGRPIALLTRPDENQFALVLDDGRVLVYSV